MERELFDEAGYLRLYSDIVQAIAAGATPSGWQHYCAHGRQEGRRPNDVDPAFYLRAYPLAADDIAAGLAPDAAAHYLRFGKARGYRPNAAAPAIADVAVPPAVPCLWTDLPHAVDLIDGRLRLGRLTEHQAGLLRQWVRDGYVTLDHPFDPRVLNAAALDIERGFAGACPDLLFSCGAVALEPVLWQPEINPYPAAALDFHYLSGAMRALLFAEPIAALLGLLFDAPALLAHSRCMLRDAAQPPQRDGDGVGYTLPRQFVSALVTLEDADPASLSCFPGSHRVPASAGQNLNRQMADLPIEPEPIAGKRGRVVLRHPLLVHAAAPVPAGATHRTVLAQYCPRYVAPLYAERAPVSLWPRGAHLFASAHYPGIDPLD